MVMVERVLGALANVIGLCGEEEAVVVVLSSRVVPWVVLSVEAELMVLLLRPTIGQAFGWKKSCVWVAVVRW